VKLPTSRAAIFGSLLCGATVGAAFGLPFGWVATQLALMGVVWLLQSTASQPRRAAGLAAAFTFSVFGNGFSTFVTGAPAALQLWSVVPWLGWSLVFASGAGLCAWLVCRHVKSFAGRWLLAWPALWVLIEWTAAQSAWAMPWLRLGQQQAPDGPLSWVLPMGGVLLASMAMWALAAAAVAALHMERRWTASFGLAATVYVVQLVFGGVVWTQATGELPVSLVQPAEKASAQHDSKATHELLQFYRDAALSSNAGLIVTPQLAIPKTITAVDQAYWSELNQALIQRSADMLVGVYIGADDKLYNTVMSLGSSGLQRYLKHQLFPFGESLPVKGQLRVWLDAMMETPMRDTEQGPEPGAQMVVAGHRIALFVCFEAAFAQQWHHHAAQAELLVNMSSDSALRSALLGLQFRQMLQARAMEFAKPVLRTSDIDGTYIIDHRGLVTHKAAAGQKALLHAKLEARSGLTLYARLGDDISLCIALVALGAAIGWRRNISIRGSTRPMAAQAGQIMLPAVVLLTISVGLLYFMINSGQAVNEKTRVTNAADAAAYSAGVVEARALNFHAYLNRSMVANQIVIAQMVSFGSWIRYFGNAVDNIGASATDLAFMLAPNPRGLVITATFAGAAYGLAYAGMTGNELADYVVQSVYGIGTGITIHDAVVQATSLVQPAVQLNLAAGVRQQQIANDVVRAMDPGLTAQVVPVTHGFDVFTRRYGRNDSGGDGRGRFADVTTRSRDQFTRERNWTIDSFDIPFVRRDPALKKRGGTDLIGFDEWRAVDTLELHGRRFGCGRFGLSWCSDIQTPIGWGAVNVNDGSGDSGRGHHGNAYVENRRTAGIADSAMEEPGSYNYSGIPASQELANLDSDAERTTGVSVLVRKRHADTLTSASAAQARPSGQTAALFADQPAGARMIALSRAQVFFDRIETRADGREEIGSLYNPYWRVRLVAPLAADKAFAAAQQGGLALP
jgi:apolipoprotein N-acyltransferase